MADFTLPKVSGGFADYGYTAWLGQSDREPPTFDGPGQGSARFDADGKYLALEPGARDVVTVEVYPEGISTCLNFNAWDAAGQAKHATSICVPASELEAVLSTLDAAEDAGTDEDDAGEPSPGESKPRNHRPLRHRDGCSVSSEPTTRQQGPSVAALLTAALLLTVRQRRRVHHCSGGRSSKRATVSRSESGIGSGF